MGLLDKLNGGGQSQPAQITPNMMRTEVGNIRQNPAAYLGRYGMKIPDGMTDPREITTYLLRSGQIGGGRVQQIMKMLGLMK